MSVEQFAVLVALVVQTGAFFWWGGSLNATVKRHEGQLEDHEERLREGKL